MKNSSSKAAVGIEVSGLGKRFGSQVVLDGIDFEVKAGETFVIMGPSGSGKSVLLKTLIGLDTQDRGKILIDGLDTQDRQTFQKIDMSMVFQAGALFNSMTVFDNLAFYPKEHRMFPKHEIDKQVRKTLSILSLDNAANKYPSELSGGMKKRVSIARSLMMRPQLLLYDEPTSELDPIMGATISEIIGTLNEEFNVTSVVVSHDVHLSRSIADKVAIMFDGKFKVISKPQDLDSVKDPQVQEFLNPTINTQNPRFRKLNTN